MNVIEQIGYFDEPTQTEPAHNPCRRAPCCVCGLTNGDGDLTWISVMPPRGNRSYFFAHHRSCKGSPKIEEFEGLVMDEVFDWDEI